ncbi:hypothetical protein FZI85_03145 [Mycobacterium sp. CBMA293]|uniref:Rv1476 family membrane protein n=1 Tax=unclassified Mycolicibacterium TaxID=2636767 RepID=UPI0012DD3908|nr:MULTISPECIES: DUF6676 family protein [unclassified Mycolicibacterium]MUL48127.1 hypothetical protein [Mycolicibacterium sp. CBMA 360]MUL58306.1 hypothetical protein [Mycolicibacterium sp. CBMA 335]MUL73764.1 hypothetical protein [Mycolicibacterium sp. CBMA 311]MUL93189.1 hypothetical protein [Mycolicibacterium sp. CBMA 230]MUM10032.1 hypothetical protein [Mycolicibacterium sp. CBMA 293]
MPFLPAFIPPDVCATVGQDPAKTPVDVCMGTVIAQVRAGGVSAPGVAPAKPPATPQEAKLAAEQASEAAGLRQVVADAQAKGIDLKIVVLPTSPGIDTPLRDIAADVGHVYPEATVLTLSPGFAGSISPTYDRVLLEAGQDLAKTPSAVQSSKNFVSQLETPIFPWTSFTLVVILGVVVAAVGTRLLQVRARKSAAVDAPVSAATAAAE